MVPQAGRAGGSRGSRWFSRRRGGSKSKVTVPAWRPPEGALSAGGRRRPHVAEGDRAPSHKAAVLEDSVPAP